VTGRGHGFSAVDGTGRRAAGLARGADAVGELLATLMEPAGPPVVRWATDPPLPPAGRLNVLDDGGLCTVEDYVAATPEARAQLGAALQGMHTGWDLRRLDEQIRARARQLDISHPLVPNKVLRYTPQDRTGVESLGRVRVFDWIDTATVVGGGVDRWNDFDHHRPDTVPWIVRRVLTADDPAAAVLEVLTDPPHGFADVTRTSGPAGPIHTVDNGRHRTHAMRILGVPLMVAEVAVYPVPVWVDERTLREDGVNFPAEPMWRGLMRRGLLAGDIIRIDGGIALQPHYVAAPWLLLSPWRAAIISAAYERIYPGALGIPSQVTASGGDWYRWCVGRR
jgi:hypothetical protein